MRISPRSPPAAAGAAYQWGFFVMTRRLAVKIAATAAAIFQALPRRSIATTALATAHHRYARRRAMQQFLLLSESDFEGCGAETRASFLLQRRGSTGRTQQSRRVPGSSLRQRWLAL